MDRGLRRRMRATVRTSSVVIGALCWTACAGEPTTATTGAAGGAVATPAVAAPTGFAGWSAPPIDPLAELPCLPGTSLAANVSSGESACETPDHTTLSRRSATVEAPEIDRRHDEPIHFAVDSTGRKTVGDGEWHALEHRTSNKRRAWRTLHLGVDSDGCVVASEVTDSGVDDASVGAAMLGDIDAAIAQFMADEAYDTSAIYEALGADGAPGPTIVIPPRRTASPSKPAEAILAQRDAAVRRIAEVGRRQWRQEAGAHQQARAGNGMFRYKRLIGDALRTWRLDAQKREAMIVVNVVNKMTALGMPLSAAVGA